MKSYHFGDILKIKICEAKSRPLNTYSNGELMEFLFKNPKVWLMQNKIMTIYFKRVFSNKLIEFKPKWLVLNKENQPN